MRSTAHPVSPATVRTAVAAKRAATPYVAHLDASLQSAHTDRNGTVHVTVSGDPAQVVAAVRGAGGQVLAAAAGKVSAVLPPSRLAALARSRGVDLVAPSVRAFVQDSEGVGASNAGPASTPTSWQGSGNTGSGVKVAIVDAGFANLAAEVTATHLPAGTTVNGNHCTNVNTTQHGTAVAEIVHQMAPDAQLFLYCIEDNTGFAQAETELAAAGVTVVNSSLGFPGDSRGDGTGATDSAAATVKKARLAGILWIQSAGNNALDYWGGRLADANNDGLADLAGTSGPDEFDSMYLLPGVGNTAEAILQFDGWPTSRAKISLVAYGWQCHDSACTPSLNTKIDTNSSDQLDQTPWVDSVAQSPNPARPPVLSIQATNTDATYPQEWDIYVSVGLALPSVHYDLAYWGDVQRSYFAQEYPARAAAGSITEPSSSPYALAVGAACVLANPACTPNSLEGFSSQGPTIDGRTKPDITGWDSVSTYLPNFGGRFYGTSAAAPHVAGAAALVKAANPAMDATQIQTFLEQRANSGSPLNPPSNQVGHGLLTLGPLTGVTPPAPSGYAALARPTRVLSGLSIGAGQAKLVQMPASVVPAGATAVAINLNAVDTTGSKTYVSVYAGGTSWPGNSNLALSSVDKQAQSFAAVPLNSGAIEIRNAGGTVAVYVDVLGYFGAGATEKFAPVPGQRLLNTQGHPVPNGGYRVVPTTGVVPAEATSVVVNVMAFNETGTGYLTTSPNGAPGTSTLNYLGYPRANLAVTGLSSGRTFRVALTGHPADVIVDLVGYFGPTGSSYVPLPAPVRVVNTERGNGGRYGALSAGATMTIQGTGLFGVPSAATALMTDVLAAPISGGSYFTAYSGATRPGVSTVAFSAGRLVSNAAMPGLDAAGGTKIYNASGSVNAYVDLFGYFI